MWLTSQYRSLGDVNLFFQGAGFVETFSRCQTLFGPTINFEEKKPASISKTSFAHPNIKEMKTRQKEKKKCAPQFWQFFWCFHHQNIWFRIYCLGLKCNLCGGASDWMAMCTTLIVQQHLSLSGKTDFSWSTPFQFFFFLSCQSFASLFRTRVGPAGNWNWIFGYLARKTGSILRNSLVWLCPICYVLCRSKMLLGVGRLGKKPEHFLFEECWSRTVAPTQSVSYR